MSPPPSLHWKLSPHHMAPLLREFVAARIVTLATTLTAALSIAFLVFNGIGITSATAAAATDLDSPVLQSGSESVDQSVDTLAGTCTRLLRASATNGIPDEVGREESPYYFQATGLGTYLLHGKTGQLLTPGATSGSTAYTSSASESAIWTVTHSTAGYRFTGSSNPGNSSVNNLDLSLSPTTGCTPAQEAELNVSGDPQPLFDDAGNQLGLVDSHAHLMGEQFLGGRLHCGLPFSPLGVATALQDCPDHSPDGWPAISEHVLSRPGPHNTAGYPDLTDWPRADSLTHEQTYYRWIERAWRGGLRMIHNYYVQNRVLCEVYPLRDEPCDEMESVRIQHRRLLDLQDYIDAQAGGRGQGFLRIVSSAQQARDVIAAGKVAVTLGIEISEPFGCGLSGSPEGDKPQCTTADIDAGLDELNSLGIRQAILTHKFDNALGGTRYDQHALGLPVELGQVIGTQTHWNLEPCAGTARDNPVIGRETDLAGRPLCNSRGLTELGEHTVNAMIDRSMIIDIDHLSEKSADRILTIVSDRQYPGVTSSHTWTDRHNYGTILQLGGAVGLIDTAAESEPRAQTRHGDIPPDYLSAWRIVREQRDPNRLFGIAFGEDMGGLAPQAAARPSAATNPVVYPFTAVDGSTVIDRQRTGNRVFDVNVDGTAHYGLLPDWIESLRLQADQDQGDGTALITDLLRAAEVYLRMWDSVDGGGTR